MGNVLEALTVLERSGGRAELLPGGKARLYVPPSSEAKQAAEVLRSDPAAVKEALKGRLKGTSVELWHDRMGRLWIVADEADAEAMTRRGVRRGEVWTAAEIEMVARIEDQPTRDEIAAFKRCLSGAVSGVAKGDQEK